MDQQSYSPTAGATAARWLEAEYERIDTALTADLGALTRAEEMRLPLEEFMARQVRRLQAAKAKQDAVAEATRRAHGRAKAH
jgi:hypothetical protein